LADLLMVFIPFPSGWELKTYNLTTVLLSFCALHHF
jgi:hypothetical protein